MSIRAIGLTAAAIATLTAAGIASSMSPEFKSYATTAAIALLGLIVLTGLTVTLIARRSDPGPPLTPTAQTPPAARQTVASGHHTGAIR